jgi:hypothetical protein
MQNDLCCFVHVACYERWLNIIHTKRGHEHPEQDSQNSQVFVAIVAYFRGKSVWNMDVPSIM